MTMTKKLIAQIEKGVTYRLKPTIVPQSEFYEVTMKCLNPAFTHLLKLFLSGGTIKAQLRTISYERYKVKAILGTLINEDTSIFFHKELIDKGETIIKNVPISDYNSICNVIDNTHRHLIERVLDILIKQEQEVDYVANITISEPEKPKESKKTTSIVEQVRERINTEISLLNIPEQPVRFIPATHSINEDHERAIMLTNEINRINTGQNTIVEEVLRAIPYSILEQIQEIRIIGTSRIMDAVVVYRNSMITQFSRTNQSMLLASIVRENTRRQARMISETDNTIQF